MYALRALYTFTKNKIWGQDLSENGNLHCEELLAKLMQEHEEVTPLRNINMDDYSRGFGKVTQCGQNCGLINNVVYNSSVHRPVNMKHGDVVEYLYYKDENRQMNIVKILSIVEELDSIGEKIKEVENKILVTKVIDRIGRDVIGSEPGVKFNLDYVKVEFVPVVGDWLELLVVVDTTDESNTVFEVLQVRSLRSMDVKISMITHWDGDAGIGTIGNTIFFDIKACSTFSPSIGDQVVVDAIESDQGILSWRAISVIFVSKAAETKQRNMDVPDYQFNGVVVTGDFNFGKMTIGETKRIDIQIINNSKYRQVINRSTFCVSKSQSQVKMIQGVSSNTDLFPKSSVNFTFECNPTFLGYSEETIKFYFKNFCIKKVFQVFVDTPCFKNVHSENRIVSQNDKLRHHMRRHMETFGQSFVAGRRINRTPAFIKVKIPNYPILKSLWDLLSDYYETGDANLVEKVFPVLTSELQFSTYKDKFHLLLHLEEIADTVLVRKHDMEQAFLLPEGDYLTVEIPNLLEGKPFIGPGDFICVKNPHDGTNNVYEGCVHQIVSDKVFIKFCNKFHKAYQGEDVSVYFRRARGSTRLCCYAIDLASKELGPQLLFPERINIKEPALHTTDDSDSCDQHTNRTKKIEWYNKCLNEIQKAAVTNALRNVCRPLPYAIFGPPGTGKTVTLVETVLQIWKLVPESRILIVTPSNSSADLIAERLIDSGNLVPGMLLRLIAYNILLNSSYSERLEPFCAALDISEQSKTHIIQLPTNVKKSFLSEHIGRQRLLVATCAASGKLHHIGFPKGHFTHVVMDEAGQATEPESMIPLTLLDKNCGQIILAGDPQQLGPVVMSTHTLKYGLAESYLGRLLKTFPYLRDIDGFKGMYDGYNPKLITKLLYNYRAIPKLLSLPSQLFYNGSLLPKVDVTQESVQAVIRKVSPYVASNKDGEYPGIMLFGIRGVNVQQEESSSWCNHQEASMLAWFTKNLYEAGIRAEDIGIISPYVEQIKFIRSLLIDLEVDLPKLGTVEEFQGQERNIILASTVRSGEPSAFNEKFKHLTKTHLLGFIQNPKRLNVLLTRAKILLVVFGNPHTLKVHHDWSRVIQYCVLTGSYTGCNMPLELDSLATEELQH